MEKIKVILAALLLGMGGYVSADVVTYAGASCKPTSNVNDTYTIDTVGKIMNYSYSNRLSLSCNIPNNHSTPYVSVTVTYIDNNPSGDMVCSTRGGSNSTTFRSSGASQGQKSFTIGNIIINNGVPLMLNCDMPKNSSGAAPTIVKFVVTAS